MALTNINTISATNVMVASTRVDTDIPRSGFIPDIGMTGEFRYDNSGAPTFYSDVFDRIITSLIVEGDGRQFVNISDMRMLAYMNALDYGLGYRRSNPIVTTTDDLRNDIPYKLHFGNNPYDPFDPMGSDPSSPIVGIPGSQMNRLVLGLTWGATAAMAASVGVVDVLSAMRITPHIITPNYGVGQPRYYPKIYTQTYTITAANSNFGNTFDVPVGVIVKRVLVMALDATAVRLRTDARITRVGLIGQEGASRRYESTWAEFKQFSADQYPHASNIDYSLVSINQLTGLQGTGSSTVIASSQPNGLGVIDFRKYAVLQGTERINPLGADMRGKDQGVLKLGIDNSGTDGQIILLWDCIEPFS